MSTDQAGDERGVPMSASVPLPAAPRPNRSFDPAAFQERAYIRRLYWASFFARFGVGMMALLVTYFQLFGAPPLEDALSYEEMGARVANEWLSGHSSETLTEIVEVGTGGWGLVLLIAVF